jgi:hypothetical protein
MKMMYAFVLDQLSRKTPSERIKRLLSAYERLKTDKKRLRIFMSVDAQRETHKTPF